MDVISAPIMAAKMLCGVQRKDHGKVHDRRATEALGWAHGVMGSGGYGQVSHHLFFL